MTDAARFANQCSSIAVTRTGAQTSIPYLSEVEKFLGQGSRLTNDVAK